MRKFAPSCCPNFVIFAKCFLQSGCVCVKFLCNFSHFSSRTACEGEPDTLEIF
eukprot:TRINITY_DN3896_c0_g1_i1.p2 TRINITY_DN3896_c0_g1~~TRINITY_DN3896_c0_g1_i1.p2  ORF type:complete len:53 (+),score=7.41 TRINITY_DN3896_c0_g1_i1:235-393(+)